LTGNDGPTILGFGIHFFIFPLASWQQWEICHSWFWYSFLYPSFGQLAVGNNGKYVILGFGIHFFILPLASWQLATMGNMSFLVLVFISLSFFGQLVVGNNGKYVILGCFSSQIQVFPLFNTYNNLQLAFCPDEMS
jgi:hypothetical protein